MATATTRPRAVSPRVAEMLAQAGARQASVTPAGSEALQPRAIPRLDDDRPANEIVRLPNYIVRERRLPKSIEVMSNAELARIGMEKYLGPENSLDRVLNLFTVAGLWKKIPVLGRFPLMGFATNEERGLALQRAAMAAERWEDLAGLMSPGLKNEAPPTAAKK
ncbi:MAG: hypothetical protein ABIZ49_10375 [Opitutaceae bacterium]